MLASTYNNTHTSTHRGATLEHAKYGEPPPVTSQNHGGRDLPEMRSQVERVGVAGARMVVTFCVTLGGVMLEASPPHPAAVAGATAPGSHRP